MSVIDDLNALVANCQAAATNAVNKINDLKNNNVDPATVSAAQQAIQAVADQLNSATA